MDATFLLIPACMSLAVALAYRARRKHAADQTRELNKIGSSLGLRRHRHEDNNEYATRLLEHMRESREDV